MVRNEAIAEGQATFVMEQFRVAAPGELEVQGTWDGVSGVDLEEPVLVLYVEDRIDHVEADGVRGSARKWHASFAWDGDPTAISKAVLHLGGRLRVDLGPQPSLRRRLGRTPLPVLALMSLPVPEQPPDADLMATQAELLAARDRLAAAEDEAELAREEARQALADAERARTLRQRDAERLREAMDALKKTAHDAVEAERKRVREQAAELERLHAEVARIEELEREREANRAALAEAERERDEARAALAEAERARDTLLGEARTARARVAELEDAGAGSGAELERRRAELEEAQQAARRTAHELESARAELQEAGRLRERLDEAEAALADARQAEMEAASDAAAARARLNAIRQALDQASAVR